MGSRRFGLPPTRLLPYRTRNDTDPIRTGISEGSSKYRRNTCANVMGITVLLYGQFPFGIRHPTRLNYKFPPT